MSTDVERGRAQPLRAFADAFGRASGLRFGPISGSAFGSAPAAPLAGLLAAAALASLACAPEPRPGLPDVVLISLDTLRADRTGVYGYAKPTTPNLDAFAREAVVFERAYTTASHTLLAHVSLLTGTYPQTHGVIASNASLSRDFATAAELLSRQGYRAGAFVNAFYLDPRFGLHRGFETYDFADRRDGPRGTRSLPPNRDGAESNAAIFAWIERAPEQPFFLFAHYFDAHSDWLELPYDAPPALRERFAEPVPEGYAPDDGEVSASMLLQRQNERGIRVGEPARRYVASLYDAGVAYADRQLGALLDGLRQRGLLERSLVVIVSDHGEEFQEHGSFLHRQIYEEVAHVPLLLAFPRRDIGPETSAAAQLAALSSRRIETPVQLTDVLPTLLAYLDLEIPETVQGRNLIPLLLGQEARGERLVYLQNREGTQYGVSDGRWKLLFDSADPAPRLYDLERDPGEGTDVATHHPRRVKRLLAELRSWLERSRAAHLGSASASAPELDEDQRAGLRALGYAE